MLSYIFAIRGFALSFEGLILAFFLGALISYFVPRRRKTLYRIPYFFLFALGFFVYVILSYIINAILAEVVEINVTWPMTLVASIAPFLFGYFLMFISVARGYDGFGNKKAAWLLCVPLLNLGLFIVTLDDDPDDPEAPIIRDPIVTPAFMNNVTGVIIATLIAVFSFELGVMTVTISEQSLVEWKMRLRQP